MQLLHQSSRAWHLTTDTRAWNLQLTYFCDLATDALAACPASRDRNVDEMLIKTNSADDSGFDNFNITLDSSKLETAGAQEVLMSRGDWTSVFALVPDLSRVSCFAENDGHAVSTMHTV